MVSHFINVILKFNFENHGQELSETVPNNPHVRRVCPGKGARDMLFFYFLWLNSQFLSLFGDKCIKGRRWMEKHYVRHWLHTIKEAALVRMLRLKPTTQVQISRRRAAVASASCDAEGQIGVRWAEMRAWPWRLLRSSFHDKWREKKTTETVPTILACLKAAAKFHNPVTVVHNSCFRW